MKRQRIQFVLVSVGVLSFAGAMAAKVQYHWPLSQVVYFFAPLTVCGLILLDLDVAVMLFFAYVTFEGMLKLMSNYATMYYVAREAILVIIFLRWVLGEMVRGRREGAVPPATIPMALFLMVCLVQFANPYSMGLFASIVALRLHVTPMALYFIAPSLVRTRGDVSRFMHFFLVLGVLASLFTVWQSRQSRSEIEQYGEPYKQLAGKYYWEDSAGEFQVRPFGVSSLGGGSGAFGQILLPIALGVLLGGRPLLRKIAVAGGILLLVTCVYLSVIRSAVMITIFEVTLLLLVLIMAEKGRPILRACLLAVLLGGGIMLIARHSDAALLRRYRAAGGDPVQSFWTERGKSFLTAWDYAQSVPWGIGLGRVSGAGRFLKSALPTPVPVWTENYLSAMILETGLPGLGLILWIIATLLRQSYLACSRVQDRELRPVAWGCWASLVGIALTGLAGPMLCSPPHNVFFWFLATLVMRLPEIERADTRGEAMRILASPPAAGLMRHGAVLGLAGTSGEQR